MLPVNGTREALFAFAQAVVDTSRPSPLVVCPNPFYQIYEGAALLAGAEPVFLNQTAANRFDLDLDSLTEDQWRRTQLMYVCSPGNPTGRVLTLDAWRAIFDRADKYGFVIASDECYSEIYPDEARPPLGALEAAHRLGRDDFRGLRGVHQPVEAVQRPGTAFRRVAGDAALLRQFLLYRTYHGCAMSLAVQHASIAAWNDEASVRENRERYREKFAAVVPMLRPVLDVSEPDAGFYLWARVPGDDDERFARGAVRGDARDGAAGTVSRARGARREPGTRLRAHGARRGPARLRRRRPPNRRVLRGGRENDISVLSMNSDRIWP